MKRGDNIDTFYVAATTAAAGWAVYRKRARAGSVPAGKLPVSLSDDPSNTLLEIPRACVKITCRTQTAAARAAMRMTQADNALADAIAAAKAQRAFTTLVLIDQFDVAQNF